MDEVSIRKFMRLQFASSTTFAGVFAASDLHRLCIDTNKTVAVVVVLTTNGSSHYVLLIRLESGEIYYINSIAGPLEKLPGPIEEFLTRYNPGHENVHFLPFRIQATGSSVCGLYVIFFAYYLAAGFNFESICNEFSESTQYANDCTM